jgi:hypothetical protein
MTRLAYWYGRVRLIGLGWLLIGAILGFLGNHWRVQGAANETSRSVFVHDYARTDGTHVHSYFRRPPGAAEHDRPYEREEWYGDIAEFVGFVMMLWFVYRFARATDRSLLKVPSTSVPQEPLAPAPSAVWFVRWPTQCATCGAQLNKGEPVWFFGRPGIIRNGKQPTRVYCRACTDESKESSRRARDAAAERQEQLRIAYLAAAQKAFGRGVVHANLDEAD